MTAADSELIYKAGIEEVMPDALLKSKVFCDEKHLVVGSRKFTLYPDTKIYVIGAGKAAAAMAKAIEEILGQIIYKGIVIVKHGHALPLNKIVVHEAGHPVPDEYGIQATRELLNCIRDVKEQDIILFLLSGGASSLLIDIPENASLDNIIELYNNLLKSGANIQEFNTIRKHLSKIKGGGLLKFAYPGTIISLIISDVPNDDLSTIGSGPTVPDSTTVGEAKKILLKYNLWDSMLPALKFPIETGVNEKYNPLKIKDAWQKNAYSLLIANNKIALAAASKKANSLGYKVYVYPYILEGEAVKVTEKIIDFVCTYRKSGKICFLFGAETTVKIRGNGKGGRCQEMVLAAFKKLKMLTSDLLFFAAGTDGQDGPTEVAGALIDSNSLIKAKSMNIDENKYLDNNDSYNFFKQIGGHVVTGPTYTNVMDIVIVLID